MEEVLVTESPGLPPRPLWQIITFLAGVEHDQFAALWWLVSPWACAGELAGLNRRALDQAGTRRPVRPVIQQNVDLAAPPMPGFDILYILMGG